MYKYMWLQGDHVSMNQQVESYVRTVQELSRYFRGDLNALGTYLSKCIFYSGMGSNDYLNNYFMTDFYSSSSQFTPVAYADALLQDYSRQLSVDIIFIIILVIRLKFDLLTTFNLFISTTEIHQRIDILNENPKFGVLHKIDNFIQFIVLKNETLEFFYIKTILSSIEIIKITHKINLRRIPKTKELSEWMMDFVISISPVEFWLEVRFCLEKCIYCSNMTLLT